MSIRVIAQTELLLSVLYEKLNNIDEALLCAKSSYEKRLLNLGESNKLTQMSEEQFRKLSQANID